MDMFGRKLPAVVLIVVVASLVVLLGAGPASADVPAGFEDKVVTSVDNPTALAFTPDDRMLVGDRSGKVRVHKDGALLATPALDISDRICANSERGLLGVAVDPKFGAAGSNFVYVYYTFKNGAPVCDNSSQPVNRVSRFVMNGDKLDPASEEVLVDNIFTSIRGNHNGGDLHFGKDGNLYISVGDAGCDYKNQDNCQGSNSASRDPNVLNGKVLRIEPDGAIPAGNPYAQTGNRCNVNGRTTAGDRCQETFAMGFRNPFRMAFDPDAAGTSFRVNDVGAGAWEEIDQGRAGADYGWNVCEGKHKNPSRPSTVNCADASTFTPPIHEYSHTSGCSSITGGAFVENAASWPAAYNDDYLFGDYVCGKIFSLMPKSGGGFTSFQFASNLGPGGPIATAFGPHQGGRSLYYTTFVGGGQVHRITYTGGNRAPDAALSADRTFSADVPMDVAFDGTRSADPDGDALTYDLDFGDGSAHATSPTANHTYTTAGTYTATLRVTDPKGLTDIAKVRIDAGNTPPTPKIESPATTARFKVGQGIVLRGSASDAEDGAVSGTSLKWEVIRHHNGSHTHPYFSGSGMSATFAAPAPEELTATNPRGNYLEIRLTATDSKGLSRTVTQRLEPKTVNVRFLSRPTGFRLRANGQTFLAPRTFVSWEGYKLNVVAPMQRDRFGNPWAFRSWSDGRAAAHTITTPPAPTTYVATFKRSLR